MENQKHISSYCKTAQDIKNLFTQKEHIEYIKANIALYQTKSGLMVLSVFPTDNIKTNGAVIKAFLELARKQGLKVQSVETNPLSYNEQIFKGEIFP